MKIIHKKAFYWGIGLSCVLIIAYIFGDPNINYGGRKNVSPIRNPLDLIINLIPWTLFIVYSIFPNSLIGKIGGFLYKIATSMFNRK